MRTASRTHVLWVGALALGVALLAPAPVLAADNSSDADATPVTCADLDVAPGEVRCFSTLDPEASAADDTSTTTAPAGLSPQDIASIYQLPTIPATVATGTGPTVAVVDAGGTPTLEADLAAYREQFGLGACTVASGCLTIVNQRGSSASLPDVIDGWDFETALDAEAVSAACPTCKIVVVQADSTESDDMDAATAIAAGNASYVSMSFGSPDAGFTDDDVETPEGIFADHPEVTFVASAGDFGYATNDPDDDVVCGGNVRISRRVVSRNCVEYPASSPHVVAAGGTVASWSTATGSWTQSTWHPTESTDPNGGGASSGCSYVSDMPSAQKLNVHAVAACGTARASTDISAIADDFAVYHADPSQNWWVMGGTSLSAPLIAAMYAQAGNHTKPFDIYARAAAQPAAFADVTSGATRGCTSASDTLHLCSAGTGWDGPTGLGTPLGLASLKPYVPRMSTTTKVPAITHAGTLAVRGKARTRRTLRAAYGTFSPSARVTVTWLVNGKPVASGTRLRVKRGWRHHRIRYVVTATASGHTPLSLTSPVVRIKR